MRIRIFLSLIFLASFFACDKLEDPIPKSPTNEEDPIARDVKKPELTVMGFSDVIETYADISITIIDDSAVETKVIHEGEELSISTEKQFEFSIDPYIIPVGQTSFSIVSTDEEGNVVSETFSVEIKHLLMIFDYGNRENSNRLINWVFFNDLDGKELSLHEPKLGEQKIYSQELVETDKIYYTKVWHVYDSGSMYNGLFLDTFEVALGSYRVSSEEIETAPTSNELSLQINNVPYAFGPAYIAYGPGYFTNMFEGNQSSTTLTIMHDGINDIYLRTNSRGTDPVFDGKKENYKYVKIIPEDGETQIEVGLNDFVPADDNIRLDIPEHDVGSLFFLRNASDNTVDFNDFRTHNIFSIDEADEVTLQYLDLPILSGLNLYHNRLTYSKNGVRYDAWGTDDDLDENMPSWTANVQIVDSIFGLNANNPEVDYYSVVFSKEQTAPDYSWRNKLDWTYGIFGQSSAMIEIPRLTLPQEISETLDDVFFQTIDDMTWKNVSATNYERYDSYEEVVDWLALNQNLRKEVSDKFRKVTFRNPTN